MEVVTVWSVDGVSQCDVYTGNLDITMQFIAEPKPAHLRSETPLHEILHWMSAIRVH
jgi:hypothetical protein